MKQMTRRLAAIVLAMILSTTACAFAMAEACEPVEMEAAEVEITLGMEAEPAAAFDTEAPGEEGSEQAVAAPAPLEAEPIPQEVVAPASLEVANKQVIQMNVGETLQFIVALNAPVSWNTSKAKVAKVDPSGVVTACAEGKAIIKAKSGKKTIKVTVKVADPHKPRSVSLQPGGTIQLALQDTLTLTPVLSPATAVATYTWKSSKKKVVEVVDGVLYPKKEGTATISVKTQNKKGQGEGEGRRSLQAQQRRSGHHRYGDGQARRELYPHTQRQPRHGAVGLHLEVLEAQGRHRG